MGETTGIEWTDSTWNPTSGCTKVSPGCDHCYAERIVDRFRGKGAFATVVRSEEKLYAPLKWRTPRRVFVNSMSDLFHDQVPDSFIARVFSVMARTPQHTFQILTKRHGRMRSLLTRTAFTDLVSRALGDASVAGADLGWPLSNVWLGVSVETQDWADIRVPALLDTPAAVRFLSCEPLLGPIDLHDCNGVDAIEQDWTGGPGGGMGAPHPFVDWVIVGGESGPGARAMHPQWARQLRDQCAAAGVPYFFKQWGGWAPGDPHGWYSRTQWLDAAEGGPSEFMYAPKSKSLRELDGRTWDEYPKVVAADAS